jgi:hypothetical protein
MRTKKFLRVGLSVVVGVLALALLGVGLVSAQGGPVQIDKMVMPSEVEVGGTVTYTIMLTATETLTGSVMVTDTLNWHVMDLDSLTWVMPQSDNMPSVSGVLTWMGEVSPTQKLMFTIKLYEEGSEQTNPDGESFTVTYPENRTVENTAEFSYMGSTGEATASFTVAAAEEMYYIYLPLVMRNFGG